MPNISRDTIHGPAAPEPLLPGEVLLHTWAADKATYWRGHGIMAVIGGFIAGVVLVYLQNPDPWVGPLAAIAALGLRGWYLASEALALSWRLTDRRLLGPGGRTLRLADIDKARPFLGDVQIITRSGDKHLMKYMAQASPVVAAIEAAKAKAAR